MLKYETIQELIDAAQEAKTSVGCLVLADQASQMELPAKKVYQRMKENLLVMRDSVKKGLDPGIRSTSGLTGGDAWRMHKYAGSGGLSGAAMTKAASYALAVSEYNASMGKIVAAPTAGSCGILPSCLITLMEEKDISCETVVHSMFTAAGFGMVIAKKASLAGAEGGCQAECGSAAAMAAAALVECMGGTPSQAGEACAMAIKNQLGLVCDPVAGLVEIPCIKRNVSGAMIAFSSADMALAGIVSKIPADEVISAMKNVGDCMSCSLKETAQGGLAATPTGKRLMEQVFGRM